MMLKKIKKRRAVHSLMSWMKRIFVLLDIESFPYFVNV